VTAKDQDGKVIHTERRKYENWNLWFEQIPVNDPTSGFTGKGKWVELRQWDITAAKNINLGLEPEQTDEETHIILVDENTKEVTIEATFLFEHEPDHWETVKKATRTIKFEAPKKYIKK
jgi:hypothetical protein